MDVEQRTLGFLAVEQPSPQLAEAGPHVPLPARCAVGDLWRLGEHRLLCGDATIQADVNRLMNGELADLCFSSPPYAQQRDYGAKVTDWDALMQGVYGILPTTEEANVLVNLGLLITSGEWNAYWAQWVEFMRVQQWKAFGWYVWDKMISIHGQHWGRLSPRHEFIFHFVRKRAKRGVWPNSTVPCTTHTGVPRSSPIFGTKRKNGTSASVRRRDVVVKENKPLDSVIRVSCSDDARNGGGHPAIFPPALPQEIMAAYSHPGQVVYEPFSGSGSQIIAAENLGRRCYAMEIEPSYCDIAIRRWEKHTGRDAQVIR